MTNNKSIILCEDDKIALDYYHILKAQHPTIQACYFPAHDSLPFSMERSSDEIILDRSKSLIDLKENNLIIITCNNFLKRIEINYEVDHFFFN